MCSYDVLTLHGEGLVSATALLVHLHYKYLVGRDGELVKDKYGTLILVARNGCGIVIGTQREDDLLLNGCTLHHLLIHNLEGHKVHLVWYIRCILHLRMKVEQIIVDVKLTQQILDAERLAADVLDVAFVVLVDSLADKVYQLRRLTAKLLQIDVESIVGTVHLTAIVNKIFHLDIQEQWLIGVFHIECVETAAVPLCRCCVKISRCRIARRQ